MQVDWKKFDYEIFEKALPEITRLYFGQDLKTDRYKDRTFILIHEDQKILTVVYRRHPIGSKEITELVSHIINTEASAGLIVSRSPQPFGLRIVRRTPNCWFPIAMWGRNQVDAIASMNSESLTEIVPFKRRSSHRGGTHRFIRLGKGGVLWSDIVNFVQLGINIGSTIGLNPAIVRGYTILRVDWCFRKAGGLNATRWQRIGSDGWFHFYKDPSSSKVVDLAINSLTLVRRIPARNPLYAQHVLKVVMGINEARNVRLDSGGPFDDDSIIAYYLLDKKYNQYDLRATKRAVLNLVKKAKQYQWSAYNTLPYFGTNIGVYGHR